MAKLKTTFGVCQEVIANLLAKPDENLQRLVCTQLCEQLTVILNFISQDSDCNMFDLFRAEVRSVISAFYEFHNTYFLGKCITIIGCVYCTDTSILVNIVSPPPPPPPYKATNEGILSPRHFSPENNTPLCERCFV